MLLLAVDTSGKPGSIALARANLDGNCAPIETTLLDGNSFSAQLVPQITTLLAKNGFTRLDIEGFAVVSGPGSFTGLRVGLAAIKALAEVLNKPIAEISMLDAIATAGPFLPKVIVALNAGKDRIFVGEYEGLAGRPRSVRERLCSREEFLSIARGTNVVTPNAEVADQSRDSGATVHMTVMPRADTIAELGWAKILGKQTLSPEALEANYLGRGDKEMFAKNVPRS